MIRFTVSLLASVLFVQPQATAAAPSRGSHSALELRARATSEVSTFENFLEFFTEGGRLRASWRPGADPAAICATFGMHQSEANLPLGDLVRFSNPNDPNQVKALDLWRSAAVRFKAAASSFCGTNRSPVAGVVPLALAQSIVDELHAIRDQYREVERLLSLPGPRLREFAEPQLEVPVSQEVGDLTRMIDRLAGLSRSKLELPLAEQGSVSFELGELVGRAKRLMQLSDVTYAEAHEVTPLTACGFALRRGVTSAMALTSAFVGWDLDVLGDQMRRRHVEAHVRNEGFAKTLLESAAFLTEARHVCRDPRTQTSTRLIADVLNGYAAELDFQIQRLTGAGLPDVDWNVTPAQLCTEFGALGNTSVQEVAVRLKNSDDPTQETLSQEVRAALARTDAIGRAFCLGSGVGQISEAFVAQLKAQRDQFRDLARRWNASIPLRPGIQLTKAVPKYKEHFDHASNLFERVLVIYPEFLGSSMALDQELSTAFHIGTIRGIFNTLLAMGYPTASCKSDLTKATDILDALRFENTPAARHTWDAFYQIRGLIKEARRVCK